MSDPEHTSMSEPVRRLELFTGSGGRRRWSEEQKAQIVAESESEASVSEVARRHGVPPQQVYRWRRQARGGRVSSNGSLSFASVVVAPAALEIEYCGATIRVSAGSDGAMLCAVLQAVKTIS